VSCALSADQRLCRQHGLHHEATCARIEHADRTQRQQRHHLHGVAHPGVIVEIVRRQRPDQRFMQRAEQGGGRELRVLRWQVAGLDRGIDAAGDFACDLAGIDTWEVVRLMD